MMKKIIVTSLLLLFTITAFAKSMTFPVSDAEWEYHIGDDPDFCEEDNDDSGWEPVEMPGTIAGDENGFYWLRSKIEIPSELEDQEIFFETGIATASMEIFVDGVLMGRHGTIEPRTHVSHVDNTIVTIPDNLRDSSVFIAIRCKNNASHCIFSPFFLSNKDRFLLTKTLQPLLNTTVYYMMSAVCLFLAFYFLLQFFLDHTEKASFAFAMTLLTISIYFFDIASDFLVMPFPIQLGFSRLCLLLSIFFLTIFIKKFVNQNAKILKIIATVISSIFVVLYIIGIKNATFHETVFTLSLIPIFLCIIYIYIILGGAVNHGHKDAKYMLIGISIGIIFGVYDIIYQILGLTPFAWLQGFAFFFMDMTMFVVISINNIRNKVSIANYADITTQQKERLNELFKKASILSKETMDIANSLNESVTEVVHAVEDSSTKASQIGTVIKNQNEAILNTSSTLDKLVSSVVAVKSEVGIESDVVETTINETKSLIDGVNQVSSVIENAANFSNTLGSLTEKSGAEISELVSLMEEIKNASLKIVEIVAIVGNFSHKTNMLSMNASIEAAHSGIAGKGFSVIAHEIKKLAEASSKESDKISDITEKITENISRGFELSKHIQSTLKQISSDASDTSKSVNESVKNLEMQKESSKRLAEASKLMTDSSTKVKDESDKQSTFSVQAVSNMGNLSNSIVSAEEASTEIINKSQDLSMRAAELQLLASRSRELSIGLNELISKN